MAAKRPVDHIAKISALGWPDLRALWSKIETGGPTRGWPAGKAFEHLILRAFQLSGAEVAWPYSVKLQGATVEQIDGMVILDSILCMVEVKDQANVSFEPLAKLRNQLLRRPSGVIGCVFSRSGFTDPAKTLAHYVAPQALLLWQGPEIGYLLDKQDFSDALRQKYLRLVQYGQPDYDARTGEA